MLRLSLWALFCLVLLGLFSPSLGAEEEQDDTLKPAPYHLPLSHLKPAKSPPLQYIPQSSNLPKVEEEAPKEAEKPVFHRKSHFGLSPLHFGRRSLLATHKHHKDKEEEEEEEEVGEEEPLVAPYGQSIGGPAAPPAAGINQFVPAFAQQFIPGNPPATVSPPAGGIGGPTADQPEADDFSTPRHHKYRGKYAKTEKEVDEQPLENIPPFASQYIPLSAQKKIKAQQLEKSYLKKADEERNKYKEERATRKEEEEEEADVETKLKKDRHRLKRLQEEEKALKEKIEEREKQYSDLKKDVKDEEEDYDQAKSDLKTEEKRYGKAKDELKDKEDEYDDLKKDIKGEKEDYEDFHKDLKEEKTAYEKQKHKLKGAEEDYEDEKDALAKKEKKEERLSKDIDDEKDKLEHLEKKVKDKKKHAHHSEVDQFAAEDVPALESESTTHSWLFYLFVCSAAAVFCYAFFAYFAQLFKRAGYTEVQREEISHV